MLIMKILKLFVLCVSSLWAFCSCGDAPGTEDVPVISGDIVLTSDVSQIRSDGTDAVTFTVIVTDAEGKEHDVTEYAEIYVDSSKEPMATNVFVTEQEGDYMFYAIYGLSVSDEIKVTAINDMPELPADPQEDNLSFRHRILLVQHTGATCSNCPRMMDSLRKLSDDPGYNGLYHHVASHSYNGGEQDAAYSEAARDLSMVYNKSGNYPMLTYNLTTTSTGTDLSEIKSQIDNLKKDKADAGIAASVKLSDDDVLINVEIKAAVKNSYRVAVWLLEDDIYSFQYGSNESWHNTHDNALRYAAGRSSQLSFVGDMVGSMESGEKAGKMFVISLEDAWVPENCEVLVLVTAADTKGNYDIANCALCPIGGSVTYDYK